MSQSATVALVHSARANAAYWSKVIKLPNARGLPSLTMQLPLSSLEDYSAVVNQALAVIDGPDVVVEPSYGGVVETAIDNVSKILSLAFVDAFAPDKGKSATALIASADRRPHNAEIKTNVACNCPAGWCYSAFPAA